MARIINSSYTPIVTLHVMTYNMNTIVSEKKLKVNDIVTDLRYVEDKQVKKITGRVSEIKYTVMSTTRNYRSIYNAKSYFASDVRATSIIIDCSSEYNSKIVEIPVREIVEDEGVEATAVRYELSYAISVDAEFTDGVTDTFIIDEGQMALGLSYMSYGQITTIDAKIAVIRYNPDLTPTSVITVEGTRVREIDIVAITDIDATEEPVVSGSLTDEITNTTGDTIYLGAATFTDALTVSKDISIVGARAGISPVTDLDAYSKLAETKIEGAVKVSADTAVVLDGVTLSGKALVEFTGAKEVVIKNSYIGGLSPDVARAYMLKGITSTTGCKIQIEGCYFAANDSTMYNALEVHSPIMDGSYVKDCYFEKGYVTHNGLNFYAAEEGATITVSGCHWDVSENAIRIGIAGEPTCTFIFENNSYDETSQIAAWTGLLLVQPNLKHTTSMKNMTIIINNTKHPDDYQLYYLYAGYNDMKFTDYNVPTIIVDGETTLAPLPEPPVVEEPAEPEVTE